VLQKGKYMNLEDLFEKARLSLGATKEERLRKSRARTILLNRILAKQFKDQEVTEELLNKKCNI
jgi:hypothetical protein